MFIFFERFVLYCESPNFVLRLRVSHKSDGGYPDSYRDQKKFFQSGKKSKNRLRFFDFLPLFKILFAATGGDLSYETASLVHAQNLTA
jgi:hypothetical protein